MATETIYYDMVADLAYRSDGTRMANGNLPELRYRGVKALNIQLLNSSTLTDFYTDLAAVTVTASVAVDNDAAHYNDGTVSTPAIVDGVAISTIKVAGLTAIPRTCGRLKLTNAAAETETINYNGWSVTGGVYTFTLADASYVVGDQTPTYAYIVGCAVRVLQLPIVKDASVDVTDKATGLFVASLDCDNIIFQDMVEGSREISGCRLELQVLNVAGERIIVKEFPVKCLYLLDDDGGIAPAPTGTYYTKTEVDALLAGKVGGTGTGATGQYVRYSGVTLGIVNGGNQLSTTVTGATDITLAHFIKGLLVVNGGATARHLKIRTATGIAYIDDSLLLIENIGASAATVQAQTGATLNGLATGACSIGAYQAGYLRRAASDTWVMPNYTATH